MTQFEISLIIINALIVIFTVIALILQGIALKNAFKTLNVISAQLTEHKLSNKQQALISRSNLLVQELRLLDPKSGVQNQKRIEEIKNELSNTLDVLSDNKTLWS